MKQILYMIMCCLFLNVVLIILNNIEKREQQQPLKIMTFILLCNTFILNSTEIFSNLEFPKQMVLETEVKILFRSVLFTLQIF